jgi:hypothetical protein
MIALNNRLRLTGALLSFLLLVACGPTAGAPAAQLLQPAQGEERITNGNFDEGPQGWSPESDGGGSAPRTDAEFGHDGAGAHLETPEGSAGVSALIQEFEPATSFTLDFWVRPLRGSSRIGLQDNPTERALSTSRVVFLDAGEPTATVVLTAWDMNYAFPMPLEIGAWYHVRVRVDSERGVQMFDINGSRTVTLVSARPSPSFAIVLGDRQPRTDAYDVAWTNAHVKDGLNGSYDYDGISLHATQ